MVKIIERSLEVKLPTTWTDEKQRWEESEKIRQEKSRAEKWREEKRREEKRKSEKTKEDQRRSEKRDIQKKEDAGARKGRKVAKH